MRNDTFTSIFIGTLFVNSKDRKQLKHPSTEDEENQLWHLLQCGGGQPGKERGSVRCTDVGQALRSIQYTTRWEEQEAEQGSGQAAPHMCVRGGRVCRSQHV